MPSPGWQAKPPFGTPINWSNSRTPGLIGAWDMQDQGGLVARDATGRYGNGTLVNVPKFKNLQGGHVLDFVAASTQSVTIADNATYALNPGSRTRATFTALFRMNSLRNYNAIISKQSGSANNNLFDCYVDGSGTMVVGIQGNGYNTTGLVANKWYHLAIVFDDGDAVLVLPNWKIYLNGALQFSTGSVTVNVPSTNPIRIGTRGDGVTLLDGQISSVRLWNRALQRAEVIAEYQNPWDIYRRLPAHSFNVGSTDYPAAFSLAMTGDAQLVGALQARNSLQLDLTAGSSFSSSLRILAALQLNSQIETATAGSRGQSGTLQLDALLDSLNDAINGIGGVFSLGSVLELAHDARLDTTGVVALGSVVDATYTARLSLLADLLLAISSTSVISSSQVFDQAFSLGAQLGETGDGSQGRQHSLALALTVTAEAAGGFMFSEVFALGASVGVSPMLVGFLYAEALALAVALEAAQGNGPTNFAGVMALAISNGLALASQAAAVGALTFNVGLANPLTSKLAAQNTLTLAVSVDLATVGGFLFHEALTLALQNDVSLAAGLRAVATISLAISAGVDLHPQTNFQDSIAIINQVSTAFRSNAALNAVMALGIEAGAGPDGSKGGSVIMAAIEMAVGIAMAFEKVNSGPGIFTGDEGGIPGIFRPETDSDDIPGIFKDPGDEGTPGIFKPVEG